MHQVKVPDQLKQTSERHFSQSQIRQLQLKHHHNHMASIVSASKPSTAFNEPGNFLQDWGQQNINGFAPLPSSEADTLEATQRPAKSVAKSTTSQTMLRNLRAARAVLSSRVAMAAAAAAVARAKEMTLPDTTKRLTYVPMSAWVDNTGDETDDTLEDFNKLPAASEISRDKGQAESPKIKNIPDEMSFSASTVERLFSFDGQSVTSNSSGLKAKPPEPLITSVTSTPSISLSSVRSETMSQSSKPQPMSPSLPPTPPPQLPPLSVPKQLQPPPAPPPQPASPASLRVNSVNNRRRILQRPSDVAALLHEILRSSSAVGAGDAKGGLAARSKKSAQALEIGNKDKAQKSSEAPGGTLDTSVLDALAKIISERISCGNPGKEKERNKNKKLMSLDQLKVNHDLLATGETKGGGDSTDKKKCSSSKALNHSRRQQNCSNCYEKPSQQYCQHLYHHGQIPQRVCSHSNHVVARPRCPEIVEFPREPLNSQSERLEMPVSESKVSRQQFLDSRVKQHFQSHTSRRTPRRQTEPPRRFPVVLTNASNATYQYSNEMFLEISDVKASSSKLDRCKRRQGKHHSTENHHDVLCRRNVVESSMPMSQCLTYQQRMDKLNSVTCSCSDDAICAQLDTSAANSCVRAASQVYQEDDLTVWRLSPPGPSRLSGCSVLVEATVGSSADAVESQTERPMKSASMSSYAKQLFNSLLKSRDESSFVQPMPDKSAEFACIRSIHSAVCIGGCEGKALRRLSPVAIFVPEFMLRQTPGGSRSETKSAIESQCITVIDNLKSEPNQTLPEIISTNSGPKPGEIQPVPLHPASFPPPPASSLPTCNKLASLSCNACPTFSTIKNPLMEQIARSRMPQACSAALDTMTTRRRSRVHVVEPLGDAIQQVIERPNGMTERVIRSLRQVKHAGQLHYLLPIFSVETILETANQPVSLFCHCSGSMITADSGVITTGPNSSLCYCSENLCCSFARRVVARSLESLKIKQRSHLDSAIDIADLLNQSLHRSGQVVPYFRNSIPLQMSKSMANPCPTWSSDAHCPSAPAMGSDNSTVPYWYRSNLDESQGEDQRVNRTLELVLVASHLAIRVRLAGGYPGFHRCSHHRKSDQSRDRLALQLSCAPSHQDTTCDLATIDLDIQSPRWSAHFGLTFSAENLANLDKCARLPVTHCPELITIPKSTVLSLPAEVEDSAFVHSEPFGFTIDAASSDYQSDPSDPLVLRTDNRKLTTDETAFRSIRGGELGDSGGGMPLKIHTAQLQARNPSIGKIELLSGDRRDWPSRGWSAPVKGQAAVQKESPDACTSSCGSWDSRAAYVTRRSNNTHTFRSHSAALIPRGRSEDADGDLLLSITCKLTVVDRICDSDSSGDSLSWDSSTELVCA